MIRTWYHIFVQYMYKRRRAKRLAAAAKRRYNAKMKFECVSTKKYTATQGYDESIEYVMVVAFYENGHGHRKIDVVSCNYPPAGKRIQQNQLASANMWALEGKTK